MDDPTGGFHVFRRWKGETIASCSATVVVGLYDVGYHKDSPNTPGVRFIDDANLSAHSSDGTNSGEYFQIPDILSEY